MGSGGAKTTNRMLQDQTNKANARSDQFTGMGNEIFRGAQNERDWLLGEYRNLYRGDGGGVAGAGGGGGIPNRRNKTWGFYNNLMNTGGWSPEEIALEQSLSAAPARGIFEGLKRQLATRGAGGGSFTSGMSRLAREGAYEATSAYDRALSRISGDIRAGKERGAAGVRGLDKEFMARQRANAARRASNARAGEAERIGYLRDIERLAGFGQDLPYYGLGEGSAGRAVGSISNRRDETPAWQRALTNIIPSAAGAAVGAFTGGSRFRSGNPIPNYIPRMSDDEARYIYG